MSNIKGGGVSMYLCNKKMSDRDEGIRNDKCDDRSILIPGDTKDVIIKL